MEMAQAINNTVTLSKTAI